MFITQSRRNSIQPFEHSERAAAAATEARNSYVVFFKSNFECWSNTNEEFSSRSSVFQSWGITNYSVLLLRFQDWFHY